MRWQQSMASDSLAKLRRIVKWWKHVVRQSKNEQHVLLSQQPPPLEGQLVLPIPDSLSDGSASLSETATSTTTFSPPRNLARPQIQRSSLSSANQPRGGSTSSLSLRSMLGRTGGSGGGRLNGNMHRIAASGGNSNSNSNRSSSSGNYNSSIIRSRSRSMSVIMNKGFSKIAEDGCWHVEGDGLDNVVRFPESTPKELAAA
ncbi:hypothetical protein BG004_008494 [Podila humilis]|nr:hypothetical protein BG004_008494 [Podila humilis]